MWADADDSSYSDTGSEWEDEPAVGPAGLSGQGVEGATFSGAPRVALPPDAHAGGPSAPPPHQPPVRDTAWRTYRRSLEWRCRWVELRLRELKAQEAHYAALEARLLARQAGGGSGGEVGAAADGQTAETVRMWPHLSSKPPLLVLSALTLLPHTPPPFTGRGSRHTRRAAVASPTASHRRSRRTSELCVLLGPPGRAAHRPAPAGGARAGWG